MEFIHHADHVLILTLLTYFNLENTNKNKTEYFNLNIVYNFLGNVPEKETILCLMQILIVNFSATLQRNNYNNFHFKSSCCIGGVVKTELAVNGVPFEVSLIKKEKTFRYLQMFMVNLNRAGPQMGLNWNHWVWHVYLRY